MTREYTPATQSERQGVGGNAAVLTDAELTSPGAGGASPGVLLHTEGRKLALGAAVVLLGILLGAATGSGVQSVLLVMASLAIYAGAYGVLLGYANQPSLGQSLFFGFGAYAFAYPSAHAFGGFWQDIGLALVIGAIGGAAIGLLVSRLSTAYHVIVTALFATIAGVAALDFASVTGGNAGLTINVSTVAVGPLTVHPSSLLSEYLLILGFAAVSFAVLYALVRSPIGLAWKALRENEVRVASVGHNTLALKVSAYAICSALIAVSGALYAFSQQYASATYFGLTWSVLPFIWVLLGGMGTLLGPVVGVALFYVFQFYVSQYWANYLILFGLVILAILRWQSGGIVGYLRSSSVLWQRALLRRRRRGLEETVPE